ncbi:hypothetical protein M422DRAFT_32029 [Sphaerobolus stellatus SS14]|uniref:Uncharacterized protein n=1 Tax=Sphaerobolus stellatus (strain SS14) TaxID=990650 RepID=A0A0C9UCV3_SPHS4|nr:hypothetical protein M422DRAFT_32029 [Sphaerobolus stellatus SS14]
MSSNRGHKQHKADANVPRVPSFVEEHSASYLPGQNPFAPAFNMFSSFASPPSQYPPGLSMGEAAGLQASNQPSNTTPSYSGLSYYNASGQNTASNQPQQSQQQQQVQPQTSQQKSGDASDLEKLRKLKEAILAGQHPYFRAEPKPDALASLWLGPHSVSQPQKEQNVKQPVGQTASTASSQSESKLSSPSEKITTEPQAQVTSVPKPSDQTSSTIATGPSPVQPVSINISNKDEDSGIDASRPESLATRPSVIIPPKSQESLVLNDATPTAGTPVPSQPPSTTQSSSAPGAIPDQNRALPSSGNTSLPPRDPPITGKPPAQAAEYKGSVAYKAPYDKDRTHERDRERVAYPLPYDSRYDPQRYSYPPDRRDPNRDAGRYPPRHGDPRYDRDRDWDRRDWDERERERDRDRARERYEYERSRPSADRRPPPPPSPASHAAAPHPTTPDSQSRPTVPLDSTVASSVRSDVSPQSERRSSVAPHPEQRPQDALPILEPRRPDLPRRPEPELIPAHPERYSEPSVSRSQPSASDEEHRRAASSGQPPHPEVPHGVPVTVVVKEEREDRAVSTPRPAPAAVGNTEHVSPSTRPAPPPPTPAPAPAVNHAAARPSSLEVPPRTPVAADVHSSYPLRQDAEPARPYYPSGAPPRPAPASITPRQPSEQTYEGPQDRRSSSSSYREPIPPTAAPPPPGSARPYATDSTRPPMDPSIPRRPESYYPPTPSPGVDRREEVRQWRERESYPSYGGPDERERARRYAETREWPGAMSGRERVRDIDIDVPPARGRGPPASWDRERPDYEAGWERKHPPPSVRVHSPAARWEDPHRPPPIPPAYEDRFIPRDAPRYPPVPSPAPEPSYRENPRVRQRSPSTTAYDDTHRVPKRVRDDYERPPYYDDARRADYPPPPPLPPPHVPSPAYYDPRDPAYGRDRAPDPYRRDMPPPPGFYPPRERYPPR